MRLSMPRQLLVAALSSVLLAAVSPAQVAAQNLLERRPPRRCGARLLPEILTAGRFDLFEPPAIHFSGPLIHFFKLARHF
jgi:hypothetical protein